MNLTQAFKMAFKSILSKKMRSLLTMLGIIIGIAAVMIIVSVINGANQKQMEYYESMGTNKITVYADLYNGTDAFNEVYTYCKGLDSVVGVTPNSYVDAVVKYGAKNSTNMEYSPQIYLGNDQYALCNNFQIQRGGTSAIWIFKTIIPSVCWVPVRQRNFLMPPTLWARR